MDRHTTPSYLTWLFRPVKASFSTHAVDNVHLAARGNGGGGGGTDPRYIVPGLVGEPAVLPPCPTAVLLLVVGPV